MTIFKEHNFCPWAVNFYFVCVTLLYVHSTSTSLLHLFGCATLLQHTIDIVLLYKTTVLHSFAFAILLVHYIFVFVLFYKYTGYLCLCLFISQLYVFACATLQIYIISMLVLPSSLTLIFPCATLKTAYLSFCFSTILRHIFLYATLQIYSISYLCLCLQVSCLSCLGLFYKSKSYLCFYGNSTTYTVLGYSICLHHIFACATLQV